MLRRHSRRDRRLNTCHRHVFLTPRRIATPVCGLVRNDRIVLSAKIKSAFVSSRDKGAVKRPLRYHSRCRARRPLSPTIRGCGVITARFRPCLLLLSAGCSGVISAPCPRPPCTETAALFASGCGAACPLHRVCAMFTMRYLLI